ncbi:MAG: phosphate ABC transporter, permease protein PstA, partial [bacterium]
MTTRRLLDRAFTGTGLFAILLMAAALLVVLGPIFQRGAGAFLFQGTIEHRRFLLEHFSRGDADRMRADLAATRDARAPVYRMLTEFEAELTTLPDARRRELRPEFADVRKLVAELLGPAPGAPLSNLPRNCYGQTRWDRAQVKLDRLLYQESWVFTNGASIAVRTPRTKLFAGTTLAPLFPLLQEHTPDMLLPRWTFYAGFLTDSSVDAHFFGGIGPEVLGTIYLTLGAMLLAIPFGVIAAIYFHEYAREGWLLSFLRSCVSTLAGVPSIVFGLFGLAFFINTLHVSHGKSV